MSSLSPTQKRDIAQRFLLWLKESSNESCSNTYLLIREASEALNIEVYRLWKAFDLLIILGRLERNNPNGRTGFHVKDFTSLVKPIKPNVLVCSRKNCPILNDTEALFLDKVL